MACRLRTDANNGHAKSVLVAALIFHALIAGSKDLVDRIQQAVRSLSGYSLLIHTDSQLMVDHLAQDSKIGPHQTPWKSATVLCCMHWMRDTESTPKGSKPARNCGEGIRNT